MVLFMQPRRLLAFFDARTHRWLALSFLSAEIPSCRAAAQLLSPQFVLLQGFGFFSLSQVQDFAFVLLQFPLV